MAVSFLDVVEFSGASGTVHNVVGNVGDRICFGN